MKNTDHKPIKTYTKKELRLMYDVSEDTFRRWLNKYNAPQKLDRYIR